MNQFDLSLIQGLENHFKFNLIDLLISKLDARSQDKLFLIVKTTNYRIFSWALENNCVKLFECLTKKLSEKQIFIALNQQAYAHLKQFIQSNLLELLDFSSETSKNFISILKMILLNQQAKWEIKDLVHETIKSAKLSEKMLESLCQSVPLLDKNLLYFTKQDMNNQDMLQDQQQNFQPILQNYKKEIHESLAQKTNSTLISYSTNLN